MKKDRNSFFQSSNFNMSASSSQMPPNFFPNISQDFYQKQPNIPFYVENTNINMNEIETRIARIERLEARLDKLEGSTTPYINENYSNNNDMYIV